MSDTSPKAKPAATIFYSWQSDLPNSTNRGFIESCLKHAIKELGRQGQLEVDPTIDRDTADVPGTPHITQTIFDKIDACDLFVGDVSLVAHYSQSSGESRATPNPNVLVELGYALKVLGWDRVLCVANTHFGEIRDMPFDLDKRRILAYELNVGEDKTQAKMLVGNLKDKIGKALSNVKHESPSMEVFFSDSNTGQDLGDTLSLSVTLISGVKANEFPDYEPSRQPNRDTRGGLTSAIGFLPVNNDYFRELAAHLIPAMATNPIKIGITNNGHILLTGVRFICNFDPMQLTVIKDLPPYPKPIYRIGEVITPSASLNQRAMLDTVDITHGRPSSTLTIDFGKLQIGSTRISAEIHLGTANINHVELAGHVFSDQFGPQPCRLRVEPILSEENHSVYSFLAVLREHQEKFT